ncbi:winged helix DNA-binding protein [Candidatus Gracilibacteria bacterium]|nr:winged helix DNA-binding protein [Candidatus Gracilibacteria bacterium]
MQEKQIIEDMFCIHNSLMEHINRKVFESHGLTLNSFIPLKMISYGMTTITQMREAYSESAASFGQKIGKLEKLGLVVRSLHADDKRKWIFTLTKKGEETIKILDEKFSKACLQFFSNFSSQEKGDFHTLLGQVENNLQSK